MSHGCVSWRGTLLGACRRMLANIKFRCATFPSATKPSMPKLKSFAPPNLTSKASLLFFVAKAPALVWQAKNNDAGKVVLRRPKNWPLVYHYHFHILDPRWGHLTIK